MASKDKIFLDADVALDHLADRQPFAEYAHRLLALAETGELTICASSLSFSNLYYILRKLKGHDDALALLGKLKLLVRVSAVTEAEIQSALSSRFKDFEDAIQHFAAKAEGGVSAIVTRNKADYANSEIPVLSPDEYLALEKLMGDGSEERISRGRSTIHGQCPRCGAGPPRHGAGGGQSPLRDRAGLIGGEPPGGRVRHRR
jgi:predicted nucleic acid-binding protein